MDKEPGYYIWSPPGSPVTAHISLEVVDRLLAEVMTGFGAIPRRGAEVGGILIGSVQGNVVRIDGFEPVTCEHRRGPSYLLSESDAEAFAAAHDKTKPASGKTDYAVGYYRSHTRDQPGLGEEDLDLMKRYFPPPSNVLLLIKPYTTKVSTAGFHVYENGALQPASPLEFPFRRYEMDGGEAPHRKSLQEMTSRRRGAETPRNEREEAPPADDGPSPRRRESIQPEAIEETPESYAITTAAQPRARKRGWIWIPLSFVFLLLGVLLGMQAALTIYPHGAGNSSDNMYSLSLTVTKVDDNVHLKWNRQAPAVLAASHGLVEITDGKTNKTIRLESTQLQNGNVLIYRPLSDTVRFRMELQIGEHTALAEVVDWKK